LIIEDCEFNIGLYLFRTVDDLNAIIRNNKIFMDLISGGFLFEINCNYPEAVLTGKIIIENNNITMSSRGSGFLREAFHFNGPQDLYF